MFLSKFRRRKGVVDRIEAYTAKPDCGCQKATTIEHITVNVPATVDGALLAENLERQIKRHGPLS